MRAAACLLLDDLPAARQAVPPLSCLLRLAYLPGRPPVAGAAAAVASGALNSQTCSRAFLAANDDDGGGVFGAAVAAAASAAACVAAQQQIRQPRKSIGPFSGVCERKRDRGSE